MPFKEKTRQWWLEVADNKCQYEFYTEAKGFQECGDTRKLQVHHIRPEGWSLDRGENPETNIGMPVCANHHVRHTNDEPFSADSSIHPDFGGAYQEYREWKQQEEHMNEILGKPNLDHSTSPFRRVANEHKVKSQRGERYWATPEEVDQYYLDKMTNKETAHVAVTGELRPKVKQHPRTDRSLKRNWSDNLFDFQGATREVCAAKLDCFVRPSEWDGKDVSIKCEATDQSGCEFRKKTGFWLIRGEKCLYKRPVK